MTKEFFPILRGAVLLAVVAIVARPVAGQSLADVARKEQERRKATASGTAAKSDKDKDKAKKVYTNKDLGPGGPGPETPPAESAGSPAGSTPESPHSHDQEKAPGQASAPAQPNAPAAAAETRDENWWRNRVTTARADLQRQTLLLEALQSRANALATDFVNRDDPAQRAQVAADRQQTLAEMEKVRTEIERLKKQLADIEDEARKAGVPPGWLR